MDRARSATHAGSWYEQDPVVLHSQLRSWLDVASIPDAASPDTGSLRRPVLGARAVIAPHAGLSYSGATAAHAYACLDLTGMYVVKYPYPLALNMFGASRRVFVLGPSHHAYLPGCALSRTRVYETPLGDLELDLECMDRLYATGKFDRMKRSVDEAEHSIEMHLPYIYMILADSNMTEVVRLVPILVGALSEEREREYGALLAPYLADPVNAFVISSDFCHWGSRFRYTFYTELDPPSSAAMYPPMPGSKPIMPTVSTGSIPIHESISRLDHEAMRIIEHGSLSAFHTYLARTSNTICGRHPIAVLLAAIESLSVVVVPPPGQPGGSRAGTHAVMLRFVKYAQSSTVTRSEESSVSYASAYVKVPVGVAIQCRPVV